MNKQRQFGRNPEILDATGFSGDGSLLTFGQQVIEARSTEPPDPPADHSIIWLDSNTDELKIKITDGAGVTREYVVAPSNTAGLSAFGEQLTAELSPLVNLAFHYSINARYVNTYTPGSGTVTQANDMALLQTTANANSTAILESVRHVHYNPGQGIAARFTAIFTTGAANSIQEIGIGNVEDGFFWGYNGTAFGVLRRSHGKKQIHTFAVTNGATTAGGTVTITLNGTAQAIEVTNGNDATEIAKEIVDGGTGAVDWSGVGNGWEVKYIGQTVYFISETAEAMAGSFSFADTDTTGVAITVAQQVAGTAPTDTWVAQSSFNGDVLDGTGSSAMTIDPTKGNVFEIQYQWLGFGQVLFCVENPDTGRLIVAHRIKYANSATTTTITNPTLPLHAKVANTSNTSNIQLYTASMGGFVQGRDNPYGVRTGIVAENASVGTTEEPIVSVYNKLVYNGKENRSTIRLDNIIISTVSNSGNKPVKIRFRINADISGGTAEPSMTEAISATQSLILYDTTADAVSGGFTVSGADLVDGSAEVIDVKPYDFYIEPGESFHVTGETSSGSHDVAVTMSWKEIQ